MAFTSKKIPIILAVASLVCSRLLFLLINDSEGPNLVVVLAGAAIIYVILVLIYRLSTRR